MKARESKKPPEQSGGFFSYSASAQANDFAVCVEVDDACGGG
jgi:hypothetical protein